MRLELQNRELQTLKDVALATPAPVDTSLTEEERRKLTDKLGKFQKKDALLDREIRRHAGCIRARPLGRDRFWNRYWFFDGYGSGVFGVMEPCMVGASQTKTLNLLPYAAGRILVEGVGTAPWLGQVSGQRRRRYLKENSTPTPFPASFGTNSLPEGQWAVYEKIEEVCVCWCCV